MRNKVWFIPIMVVALNALALIVRWSYMPERLPVHFDIQGNADNTMPRTIMLLYIVMGLTICLIAYLIGRKKPKLQTGLVILASGLCLVLLSSTMVMLTSGTMPVFMFAEPVILLAAIIGFVVSVVKSRKKIS